MAMKGSGPLSTDELGRLQAHQNIFFVDTSVLPMIPGTTIGLFAMANAHRIASKVLSIKDLE
jgi:choline dehydrogenase-like flavoprotein